jgi:hypothetical protein
MLAIVSAQNEELRDSVARISILEENIRLADSNIITDEGTFTGQKWSFKSKKTSTGNLYYQQCKIQIPPPPGEYLLPGAQLYFVSSEAPGSHDIYLGGKRHSAPFPLSTHGTTFQVLNTSIKGQLMGYPRMAVDSSEIEFVIQFYPGNGNKSNSFLQDSYLEAFTFMFHTSSDPVLAVTEQRPTLLDNVRTLAGGTFSTMEEFSGVFGTSFIASSLEKLYSLTRGEGSGDSGIDRVLGIVKNVASSGFTRIASSAAADVLPGFVSSAISGATSWISDLLPSAVVSLASEFIPPALFEVLAPAALALFL